MVESGPGLLLPTKPTRTKPINVPPLASAPARQSIDLVNTIEITSDAEEDHATGRKRTAPRMEQNPKRQRFGNDSQTIFDRIVPYAPRVENFTKQEVIRKKAKRFTLAEIRQKIDQVNKGLPGGRDHRIVEHMMRESSEHWPEVLENFHNVTAELFREAINRCMNTAFPRWSKVPLGKKLKKISEGFVEQALEELWEQSSQSLDIEMNRLITMNEKWMNDRSYESLKELKTHFRDNRRETFAIETANRNIVVDAATQKAGAERQVEKECILAAQELSEMAVCRPFLLIPPTSLIYLQTTRAYYSLASQRLADTIVQRTCYHLFTGTRDNMGDHIMEELGMNLDNANESLRESLMVSPVAMKERQRLEEEIETLEKARLQLKALTSS